MQNSELTFAEKKIIADQYININGLPGDYPLAFIQMLGAKTTPPVILKVTFDLSLPLLDKSQPAALQRKFLFFACRQGDLEGLKSLIQKGFNPLLQEDFPYKKYSAISAAIDYNKIDIITYLLQNFPLLREEASSDLAGKGNLLHFACSSEKVELKTYQALIENGVNPNSLDVIDQPPIFYALEINNDNVAKKMNIIKLFIEQGKARTDFHKSFINKERNIFLLACRTKDFPILCYLVRRAPLNEIIAKSIENFLVNMKLATQVACILNIALAKYYYFTQKLPGIAFGKINDALKIDPDCLNKFCSSHTRYTDYSSNLGVNNLSNSNCVIGLQEYEVITNFKQWRQERAHKKTALLSQALISPRYGTTSR